MLPNIQDDSINAMIGLTQGSMSYAIYTQQLQLLRKVHPSFQRPYYGSIDGLIAEVPSTKGHLDACLFGSL
jgi:hypothetical protein